MDFSDFKKSGIIHKIIRNEIHKMVKPGVLLFDIRKQIEKLINRFSHFEENSYNHNSSSIAFPVGLSINNCAAHFSPFSYDEIKYTENDILKVDYGVQFNGHIIDAAFSITHNPELELLKKISEEATNNVIKMSGVDQNLGDLGKVIEEIFYSYEIEINNKKYQVRPCNDLCGHQILPYKIHGKKAIPNICFPYKQRMEEGEIYAVETFPTTGRGNLIEKENSHYMINYTLIGNNKYKNLGTYKRIYDRRKTLAWHLDWLSGDPLIKMGELQILLDEGLVSKYPALYDIDGSYVAQTEHTIGITENGVRIFS